MQTRRWRRWTAGLIVGWSGAVVTVIAAPAAAADRAYELVSPQGGASQVRLNVGTADAVADGGEVVCYALSGETTDGSDSGGDQSADGYCARRTTDGWASERYTEPPGEASSAGLLGSRIRFLSADGRRAIFATDRSIDGTPPGYQGFLRADGTTTWVTGPTGIPPAAASSRSPAAASTDLSTVLFQTNDRVLPDVDANAVADVYLSSGGQTTLVSVGTGGTAAGGTVAMLNSSGSYKMAVPGSLSTDGSRVIFLSAGSLVTDVPAVQTVYRWSAGTLLAVPRRGPLGTTPTAMTFVGASSDGDVIYVSTSEQLTTEPKSAGAALYRYVVSTDELTLVASGSTPTALGISDDGSTLVYRTSTWQLFAYREGASQSIGTIASADTQAARVAASQAQQRGLRISPDGSTVVFVSAGSLEGSSSGKAQVFRWRSGQGLVRVSPDPVGGPATADATIGNWTTQNPIAYPNHVDAGGSVTGNPVEGRVMTTDGNAVFFQTADALVDEDTNGTEDVYEWSAGTVKLISPGDQPYAALYHGSSADGSTVFFTTYERILPDRDINQACDLYAARVGGGFPALSGSSLGAPPTTVGPGTAGPAASPSTTEPRPDEPIPSSTAEPSEVKPAAAMQIEQRRLTAKRSVVRVRVRVSRAGDLDLALSSAYGSGSASTDEAGVLTASLRLSGKARRQLARRGYLRTLLTASFTTDDGDEVRSRAHVTIRASKMAGKSAGKSKSRARARRGR